MLQAQDEGEAIGLPTGNLDKHGGFEINGVMLSSYDVAAS